MTPYELQVLLHCYTIAEPLPFPKSEALNGIVLAFTASGLIRQESGYYVTTDKGIAYMKQILNVKPPRLAWVDDNGELLGIVREQIQK